MKSKHGTPEDGTPEDKTKNDGTTVAKLAEELAGSNETSGFRKMLEEFLNSPEYYNGSYFSVQGDQKVISKVPLLRMYYLWAFDRLQSFSTWWSTIKIWLIGNPVLITSAAMIHFSMLNDMTMFLLNQRIITSLLIFFASLRSQWMAKHMPLHMLSYTCRPSGAL